MIARRRAGHGVAAKPVRSSRMISTLNSITPRLLIALLAGGIAFASVDASFAQAPARHPAAQSGDAARDGAPKEQSKEARRLPADVSTDHTLELPDRTLRFKATAGSIPIRDAEGKLQAEIAYIAYERPDSGTRAV